MPCLLDLPVCTLSTPKGSVEPHVSCFAIVSVNAYKTNTSLLLLSSIKSDRQSAKGHKGEVNVLFGLQAECVLYEGMGLLYQMTCPSVKANNQSFHGLEMFRRRTYVLPAICWSKEASNTRMTLSEIMHQEH